MQNYQTRLSSFRKWPHTRSKSSSSSNNNFKATPTTLARANFFHLPSKGSPDNVCCWLCGKNLEGWEPEDEPFTIHRLKSPNCPLSTLHLREARLATFKGSIFATTNSPLQPSITPAILADAGFWLNCQESEDEDVVSCFQCGVTLGNWEPGDDPLAEHCKRNPKCPFLMRGTRSLGSCFYEKFFSHQDDDEEEQVCGELENESQNNAFSIHSSFAASPSTTISSQKTTNVLETIVVTPVKAKTQEFAQACNSLQESISALKRSMLQQQSLSNITTPSESNSSKKMQSFRSSLPPSSPFEEEELSSGNVASKEEVLSSGKVAAKEEKHSSGKIAANSELTVRDMLMINVGMLLGEIQHLSKG